MDELDDSQEGDDLPDADDDPETRRRDVIRSTLVLHVPVALAAISVGFEAAWDRYAPWSLYRYSDTVGYVVPLVNGAVAVLSAAAAGTLAWGSVAKAKKTLLGAFVGLSAYAIVWLVLAAAWRVCRELLR